MEKKKYVSPLYSIYNFTSQSFIAGSSQSFDEDSEEFQGLLDDCLQLAGQVTNEQLKTYLLAQTNHTACFKGWTVNESDEKSCFDTRFSDAVGVTIKYDEANSKFIMTFNSCTGWVTDPVGNAGNTGNQGGNSSDNWWDKFN
ncbi:MAG: hypothetical protein IJ977_06340 [Fibrobacter sp.]|nr:hypothetical protein [Fibrobacter sp.]